MHIFLVLPFVFQAGKSKTKPKTATKSTFSLPTTIKLSQANLGLTAQIPLGFTLEQVRGFPLIAAVTGPQHSYLKHIESLSGAVVAVKTPLQSEIEAKLAHEQEVLVAKQGLSHMLHAAKQASLHEQADPGQFGPYATQTRTYPLCLYIIYMSISSLSLLSSVPTSGSNIYIYIYL